MAAAAGLAVNFPERGQNGVVMQPFNWLPCGYSLMQTLIAHYTHTHSAIQINVFHMRANVILRVFVFSLNFFPPFNVAGDSILQVETICIN